jgi:hypothetical protein
MGGTWGPIMDQSFDNIGFAMNALLQMSTTEGWVDIMLNCVSSRGRAGCFVAPPPPRSLFLPASVPGVDMQPTRNAHRYWIALFILFILFGGLFITNLFVGVVIDNFNRMKDEMGGTILLTGRRRERCGCSPVSAARATVRTTAVLCRVQPRSESGRRRTSA